MMPPFFMVLQKVYDMLAEYAAMVPAVIDSTLLTQRMVQQTENKKNIDDNNKTPTTTSATQTTEAKASNLTDDASTIKYQRHTAITTTATLTGTASALAPVTPTSVTRSRRARSDGNTQQLSAKVKDTRQEQQQQEELLEHLRIDRDAMASSVAVYRSQINQYKAMKKEMKHSYEEVREENRALRQACDEQNEDMQQLQSKLRLFEAERHQQKLHEAAEEKKRQEEIAALDQVLQAKVDEIQMLEAKLEEATAAVVATTTMRRRGGGSIGEKNHPPHQRGASHQAPTEQHASRETEGVGRTSAGEVTGRSHSGTARHTGPPFVGTSHAASITTHTPPVTSRSQTSTRSRKTAQQENVLQNWASTLDKELGSIATTSTRSSISNSPNPPSRPSPSADHVSRRPRTARTASASASSALRRSPAIVSDSSTLRSQVRVVPVRCRIDGK